MSISNDFSLNPGLYLSDGALVRITQYCIKAFEAGPCTGQYMVRMVAEAKMEKRLLDGCKAILRLKKVYGPHLLESACQRGLQARRCNYTVIRTILCNCTDASHPEVVAPPSGDNAPRSDNDTAFLSENPPTHENLRGTSSFEI